MSASGAQCHRSPHEAVSTKSGYAMQFSGDRSQNMVDSGTFLKKQTPIINHRFLLQFDKSVYASMIGATLCIDPTSYTHRAKGQGRGYHEGCGAMEGTTQDTGYGVNTALLPAGDENNPRCE